MADKKVRVVFEAVLGKFQRDIKSAAKTTLGIGDAGKKAAKGVNFDDSNKSVNTLDGSLKKLGGTLKTLALGYMGKKLFDAGKENLMFFADYQKELTKTFTLLPEITEEGMDRMSRDVKQFSKDMKVLPEEVLPALYQAISASVPESEVFGFLEVARKSAVGGVTETNTAVDVLSSVVNAYGNEVISANEASDLMFMAMRKGKTTFEEMASNMYSVLPSAKALEVPFENITAGLATMTSMGTPTAQATTQLGRMFLEFSKEGTRASEIFLEATGRTFKQFIAEGNNLQDALTVMESVANSAGMEINNLFSSAEAGNAALALTGEGAIKFAEDLKAMEESAGATEKAYEKMSGTISFMLDGIRAKVAVFKLNIAEQYFPEIQDAITKVDESFDRLEQNGSLDRLAQSIGGIISTIILKFDSVLNNIDNIIGGIDKLASFIDNNLSGAIDVVMRLVKAFALFKTAAAVGFVINAVAEAIGLLTGAQWALNIAMNANPIGLIITLLAILLIWLIKVTGGFENFKNVGKKALAVVKLAFYKLTEGVIWGVDKILGALNKLLGWIPGIGTAFESAAIVSGNALAGIRGEISKTMTDLHNLRVESSKPILKPDIVGDYTPIDLGAEVRRRKSGAVVPPPPMPTYTPPATPKYKAPKVPKGGSSSSVPKPKPVKKTIQDRIRDVQDKHSPDIDLYESRASLAESKDDSKATKANKNLVVEALRRQANDLLKLQQTKSGKEAKIVEAARNNVLLKIEDTLKDINDSVNQIVGDFSIPSELKTLTKYQYDVEKSTDKLGKRMVYSPNVDMYLTIEDTEGKGVNQVQREIEGFTNAIFGDKNDLVTKFMQDVTRN